MNRQTRELLGQNLYLILSKPLYLEYKRTWDMWNGCWLVRPSHFSKAVPKTPQYIFCYFTSYIYCNSRSTPLSKFFIIKYMCRIYKRKQDPWMVQLPIKAQCNFYFVMQLKLDKFSFGKFRKLPFCIHCLSIYSLINFLLLSWFSWKIKTGCY